MEDTELAKMIRVDRSTRIVLQTLVSREVVEIIGTHGGHEVKGISGTHPLAAGSSRVQALLAPSSKLQASSFKVNNCTLLLVAVMSLRHDVTLILLPGSILILPALILLPDLVGTTCDRCLSSWTPHDTIRSLGLRSRSLCSQGY